MRSPSLRDKNLGENAKNRLDKWCVCDSLVFFFSPEEVVKERIQGRVPPSPLPSHLVLEEKSANSHQLHQNFY